MSPQSLLLAMVRRQRRKKGLLILFSDKLTAVLIEIK